MLNRGNAISADIMDRAHSASMPSDPPTASTSASTGMPMPQRKIKAYRHSLPEPVSLPHWFSSPPPDIQNGLMTPPKRTLELRLAGLSISPPPELSDDMSQRDMRLVFSHWPASGSGEVEFRAQDARRLVWQMGWNKERIWRFWVACEQQQEVTVKFAAGAKDSLYKELIASKNVKALKYLLFVGRVDELTVKVMLSELERTMGTPPIAATALISTQGTPRWRPYFLGRIESLEGINLIWIEKDISCQRAGGVPSLRVWLGGPNSLVEATLNQPIEVHDEPRSDTYLEDMAFSRENPKNGTTANERLRYYIDTNMGHMFLKRYAGTDMGWLSADSREQWVVDSLEYTYMFYRSPRENMAIDPRPVNVFRFPDGQQSIITTINLTDKFVQEVEQWKKRGSSYFADDPLFEVDLNDDGMGAIVS